MTVKRLGQGLVSIADLQLPDDMEERMASPLVQKIARTERDLGILQPPLVRKRDLAVVAGRNRVAARLLNGHEDVLVDYVNMTNKELQLSEKVENAFRVHDKDAADRAIREIYSEFREEEEVLGDVDDRPAKRGRPSTAHSRAVKRTAETAGVSRTTVERKVAEEEQEQGPVINTWGLELDERWLDGVKQVQTHMGEVRAKLRRLLQVVSTLVDSPELSVPTPLLVRSRDAIREVAADLKQCFPENLCPACKGIDFIQDNCGFCRGAGWVGEIEQEQWDPKLLTDGYVWCRGKLMPLDEALDQGSEYEEEEVDF